MNAKSKEMEVLVIDDFLGFHLFFTSESEVYEEFMRDARAWFEWEIFFEG